MQTGQTGPGLGQVFADIRGTLASLMSSKGTPEGLQRIILSWDFWEIEDNASNGGGVIPDLEALPKSFDSAEVLLCLTCAPFDVLNPRLLDSGALRTRTTVMQLHALTGLCLPF